MTLAIGRRVSLPPALGMLTFFASDLLDIHLRMVAVDETHDLIFLTFGYVDHHEDGTTTDIAAKRLAVGARGVSPTSPSTPYAIDEKITVTSYLLLLLPALLLLAAALLREHGDLQRATWKCEACKDRDRCESHEG